MRPMRAAKVGWRRLQARQGAPQDREDKKGDGAALPRTGLAAPLVILLTLVALPLCWPTFPSPRVYAADPAGLEFRGLIWRTIDRYYHPGIYAEIYGPEEDRRLLGKARAVGANFLLLRAFYSCSESGELVGDDAEAGYYLGQAIAAAHAEGFGVFLTPYVESACFWPDRECTLAEGAWTQVVLKWAAFAAEHGVELFAPGFEMSLIFPPALAASWYQEILPRLRRAYPGRIAVAEHPYIGTGRWEVLDREGAFAGYDCFGISVFPWKRYGDEIDMRSLADYRADVVERAELARGIAGRQGIDCVFFSALGMDLWCGGEPDPEIRARAYELGIRVAARYDLCGVFLHSWASEPDQLGSSTAVEAMLRRVWRK